MENNITYHHPAPHYADLITYYQAMPQHAQGIVDVINNHAIKDNTKIVILPKQFRAMAVEQNIAQKRLYCALNQAEEVVAFKKLFIINNKEEYTKITQNEIRCKGNNPCIKTQIFNGNGIGKSSNLNLFSPFSFKNSVVIYCGGDYTMPAYRNQKVNSNLTHHAFNSIKNDAIDTIKKNNLDNIVLLYGLAKINAGEEGGIDRTPSIVRALKKFSEQIIHECFNITSKSSIVFHQQYEALMPIFDPESNECGPLPDDESIPKYGNVLTFPLGNTNTK